MNKTDKANIENQQEGLESWFDDLISQLRSHQIQLETGTASKEVEFLYEKLMTGSMEEVFHQQRKTAQQFFVRRIIVEFLQALDDLKPRKLAFDYNNSEVLVWVEIDTGDEETERKILSIEGKLNARYHSYGFDINSTIVEHSDHLPIPEHYKTLKS